MSDISSERPAYIIIDTETSGLFDFSKPADAEGQPRLAHLALIFVDADLEVEREHEVLVRPEGWELSPEMTAINGLTNERLLAEGLPILDVLAHYTDPVDQGRIVVAFNAQYDTKIMRGELRRAGLPDRFEATRNICAMRALVDVCQLPKKTGRGYKFPKLAEALAHFEIEQDGAHTALGDARSCLALFRHAVRIGVLPGAAVHYAKRLPAAEPALKTSGASQ